ncbi:MAG: glutaredoxin family protein [Candidatus Doudnabacteria bacterium]|nr:glutaredoxin family protein [Candidatus Doudnabacteria bacterium]MCA9387948.1 glutaredoxin family protein [Candidatus Andersenbacteria bacterium]
MKSVTVYSTPTCPYCHQLKEYLKENNVSFEDKDVATDAAARDEMVQKSGQLGVPVSDIDGEIVVGFDREKVSELLGLNA